MTYPKNTGRSYTQSWLSQGFTLIELLVVVLIIGILAAVAVPQYQKAVRKSRFAQVDIIMDAANKAITMYGLENGMVVTGTPSNSIGGVINFTGKDRVGTIEIPGNCDFDSSFCYTDIGRVGVGIYAGWHSLIDLNFSYNADKTQGNTKLGSGSAAFILEPSGWELGNLSGTTSDTAVICEYAKSRGYPASDSYITNQCSAAGVTL